MTFVLDAILLHEKRGVVILIINAILLHEDKRVAAARQPHTVVGTTTLQSWSARVAITLPRDAFPARRV